MAVSIIRVDAKVRGKCRYPLDTTVDQANEFESKVLNINDNSDENNNSDTSEDDDDDDFNDDDNASEDVNVDDEDVDDDNASEDIDDEDPSFNTKYNKDKIKSKSISTSSRASANYPIKFIPNYDEDI